MLYFNSTNGLIYICAMKGMAEIVCTDTPEMSTRHWRKALSGHTYD